MYSDLADSFTLAAVWGLYVLGESGSLMQHAALTRIIDGLAGENAHSLVWWCGSEDKAPSRMHLVPLWRRASVSPAE